MNLIITTKPWNINFFKKKIKKLPGRWKILTKKNEVKFSYIKKLKPKNIFFIHWSWYINNKIVESFNCINFHMTNLPNGRGGSPLQNLILEKKKTTKVTAHKMTSILDHGPIYFKSSLSLKGNASEIYLRATKICHKLIIKILNNKFIGKMPKLKKIEYKRLTYKNNKINFTKEKKLVDIYDKIRMVDAPTYKSAYFRVGNYFLEFKNAKIKNKNIETLCLIKKF